MKKWLFLIFFGFTGLHGYRYRFTNEAGRDLIIRLHLKWCSQTLEKPLMVADTIEIESTGVNSGCAVDSLMAIDVRGNTVANAGSIGIGNKDYVIRPQNNQKYKYKFIET